MMGRPVVLIDPRQRLPQHSCRHTELSSASTTEAAQPVPIQREQNSHRTEIASSSRNHSEPHWKREASYKAAQECRAQVARRKLSLSGQNREHRSVGPGPWQESVGHAAGWVSSHYNAEVGLSSHNFGPHHSPVHASQADLPERVVRVAAIRL
jgi:hypothetical protein